MEDGSAHDSKRGHNNDDKQGKGGGDHESLTDGEGVVFVWTTVSVRGAFTLQATAPHSFIPD